MLALRGTERLEIGGFISSELGLDMPFFPFLFFFFFVNFLNFERDVGVVCHRTGSGHSVPHTPGYSVTGIVEKVRYALCLQHTTAFNWVLTHCDPPWAGLNCAGHRAGSQGPRAVKWWSDSQLTRVSFASGPWTACSPHVSWVKTLVQIREAGSKYVVALPHAPKETTPRDIASWDAISLPRCSFRIILNTWLLAVTF